MHDAAQRKDSSHQADGHRIVYREESLAGYPPMISADRTVTTKFIRHLYPDNIRLVNIHQMNIGILSFSVDPMDIGFG